MDQGPSSSAADHGEPPNNGRRSEERRVVTTLFCDLVGFTSLSERNDPEIVDAFLRRYYAVARKAVESFGGTVEKFIGDAVVAVFGVPTMHEDDPERAIRAGLRMIDEVDALTGIAGQAVEVRVGINTGESLVRLDVDPASGEGFLTGDAVNVAARLQSAAPSMAVAVGEATHAATEQVFAFDACHPVALKGKTKPLQAWIATAPLARTGSELRSFASEFVGREEELAELDVQLGEADAGGRLRCALVVGEPGIGKSRLLAEFARRLDDRPEVVTWRQGRCLPFGSNVTFWALSELVRAEAGVLESDGVARTEARLEAVLPNDPNRDRLRARLRPLLGLQAEEASREENFAAWAEFLEGFAAAGPAIVVIEDLHWADEALLAFMDFLADDAAAVPLLVLATARPQMLELAGPGAAFTAGAQKLALGPLSGEETAALARARLGAKSLPTDLQALILERSGGNPLFAEELVRLLEDRDLIEQRRGRVVLKEGAEVPMSDSIGALIAARLDLLSHERKALLADAAVVGRSFWTGAVAAVGEREPADVLEGLMELVAKELVRPERSSSIEGESEFSFVHALVCDVAYEQLTRADRAAKHARLARWLEGRAAGRTEELAELLAFHYSTALDMANACGLFDLEDELADPTTRYLELAGGRAAPLDAAAAAQHFARAERVADEAAKPKRRFFLSRRARRTLKRRAPLLTAAVAVIAVAALAAFAIHEFKPAAADPGPVRMTPAQIAAAYGSSVVRITTPVLPASATGTNEPGSITGSGFMATNDGVIVTSTAVVQGIGSQNPVAVTVEYALPSGQYGKTTGRVWDSGESFGVAMIVVDPREVPLEPLPLGDSDSAARGERVVALGRQNSMSPQTATGVLTGKLKWQDMYTGNDHFLGLADDVEFPAGEASQPLAGVGGPLFDTTGHVIGVVGPYGVGGGDWTYSGDITKQAAASWCVKTGLTYIGSVDSIRRAIRRAKVYLGLDEFFLTPELARALGVHQGVLVGDTRLGSPADKAGIWGQPPGVTPTWVEGEPYWLGGDIVVSVDGVRLTEEGQLAEIVQRHKPGDVISIRLWRDGRFLTVKAKLAAMP